MTLESRTSVMKVDLVLDIQVGTPVTDFSPSLVLGEFQDWMIIRVMDGDLPLIFFRKVDIGAWFDIIIRAVSDGCATLCDR